MVKTRSSVCAPASVEKKRCSATRKNRRRRSITMPQKKRKLQNEQYRSTTVDTKSPQRNGTPKDLKHVLVDLANSTPEIVKKPAKRTGTTRTSRSNQKENMETSSALEISGKSNTCDGVSSHTSKVMNRKRTASLISKEANPTKPFKSQKLASDSRETVPKLEKKKKPTTAVENVTSNNDTSPKEHVRFKDVSDVLNDEAQQSISNKNLKIEESTSKCSEDSVCERIGDKSLAMNNGKGWNAEQDSALQNAYFQVRPSPNFWFEVSKKVPGKTAKECFDRYYSAYPTPPIAQPRSRKVTTESPVRAISFLSPLSSKPHFGRGKQGLLKAHKTVRHILRQQTAADGTYEADVFSTVEESIPEDSKDAFFSPASTFTGKSISSECNYATPADHTGALKRCKREVCSVSSKSHGNFARNAISGNRDLLSPEILKRETNPARLDKYLDMLHRRHVDKKTISSRGAPERCSSNSNENSRLTNTVSTARNAIINTAKEVLKVLTKQPTVEEENSSLSDEFDEEDSMNFLDD